MTYTYTCTNCGEIVEITCSIAEKDEKEKSLVCPSCGGREFVRVFNAFIARKRESGGMVSVGSCACSQRS
ncbi:MAG: FmdB family zinc ribbon protein [Armatimonadota bacterium]